MNNAQQDIATWPLSTLACGSRPQRLIGELAVRGEYTNHLPEWIGKELPHIAAVVSKEAASELENFLKGFALVNRMIAFLPSETTCYELYQISPDSLKSLFQNVYTALTHAAEALLTYYVYNHAHKYRAGFDGFKFSLDSRNFLLAFACARTCFEETAHFHYYLVKLEVTHSTILNVWKQIEARSSKNRMPTKEINERFVALHLELLQKLKKAREGSDYDWSGWFGRRIGQREFAMSSTVREHDVIRKTHISDCMDELDQKKQLNATEIYALLCEMVHPNFGANTLILSTRKEVMSGVAGNVTLASHPKNLEAASWFFEVGAAPLARMFEKEVEYNQRANKILSFYKLKATALGAEQGLFTVKR
jgi:hypothetical protein